MGPPVPVRATGKDQAFVKVQDGCDHRCSYCIIPDLRGNPVERPPLDILDEVSRIASSGCPEVVFTDKHWNVRPVFRGYPGRVGQKGRNGPGNRRIRLGSIEPFAVSLELLEDLSSTPQFCPHLHLPLQSGDAEILEKMNRGYTPRQFEALILQARRILGEDLHVSTDVIVGFPGESEEAFDSTMRLLEITGTGRVHVFPFSPREGTPASLFGGRVQPEVKNSRRARACPQEPAPRSLLREMGWQGS